MRKKITLLVLQLSIEYGFGQQVPSVAQGIWIKYKVEKKDGNTVRRASQLDSSFISFHINDTTIGLSFDPIAYNDKPKVALKYTFQGNVLKTSAIAGYVIEKSSNDTLVLCEKVEGTATADLKRFYLVRNTKLNEIERKKLVGTKNIVATPWFTPKLKVNIGRTIKLATAEPLSDFYYPGELEIFPTQKTITSKIKNPANTRPEFIKIATNSINNSFSEWDLTNFEAFESVKIPFVIAGVCNPKGNSITIIYFTNDVSKYEKSNSLTHDASSKAYNFFLKGMKAYSRKKYAKAIGYFSESFHYNPNNTDALFNIATSYYEMGDKENACKTWQQLDALGEADATLLYKNNCN